MLLEPSKLLGVPTKIGPSAYEEMRMIVMYRIYHLLIVAKFAASEVHGVSIVIGSPILPVLHHTVQWNLQLTVTANHPHGLISTLVTLF